MCSLVTCSHMSQVVICHSESYGGKDFLALIHFLNTNFVVGGGFLILLFSRAQVQFSTVKSKFWVRKINPLKLVQKWALCFKTPQGEELLNWDHTSSAKTLRIWVFTKAEYSLVQHFILTGCSFVKASHCTFISWRWTAPSLPWIIYLAFFK